MKSVFVVLASTACLCVIIASTMLGWVGQADARNVDSALAWVEPARILLRAFLALAFCAQIAWLVWVHATWKRIHAVLRPEDAPTPNKAVLMLLTPVVNLLWQFTIVVGACSLVNDALVKTNAKRRAPTGVAVLWCLFGSWAWAFVPLSFATWFTVAVPLLGFLLMRRLDAALDELTPVSLRM